MVPVHIHDTATMAGLWGGTVSIGDKLVSCTILSLWHTNIADLCITHQHAFKTLPIESETYRKVQWLVLWVVVVVIVAIIVAVVVAVAVAIAVAVAAVVAAAVLEVVA